MNKNMAKIWDILSWIAFAIVFLYFLLKILGVLNSPVSIDVITLLSGAYLLGRHVKKIDIVVDDVEYLKKDVGHLKSGFNSLKKDINYLKLDADDIKVDVRKLNRKCPVLTA